MNNASVTVLPYFKPFLLSCGNDTCSWSTVPREGVVVNLSLVCVGLHNNLMHSCIQIPLMLSDIHVYMHFGNS